jgi:hypothetical protein
MKEIQDQEVVSEIIHRLYPDEPFRVFSRPEVVTVDDIAEALDLPIEVVEEELRKVYAEHEEARLQGILRELERPLYSVERPGHAPLLHHERPLNSLQSVKILAKQNADKAFIPRRRYKAECDHETQRIAYVVLLAFLALALLLVIRGR